MSGEELGRRLVILVVCFQILLALIWAVVFWYEDRRER
jgi:hypothetical protein